MFIGELIEKLEQIERRNPMTKVGMEIFESVVFDEEPTYAWHAIANIIENGDGTITLSE